MRHWEAGHGIDDEFEPKRKKHGITYRDVKRTINQSAELIAYEHWGCNRIGIWRKETGVLLILRIREGDALALYSAQDYEDIHDPMGCGEMTNIRWLKQ